MRISPIQNGENISPRQGLCVLNSTLDLRGDYLSINRKVKLVILFLVDHSFFYTPPQKKKMAAWKIVIV